MSVLRSTVISFTKFKNDGIAAKQLNAVFKCEPLYSTG